MRLAIGAAAALVGVIGIWSLSGDPAPAGPATTTPVSSSWMLLSEGASDGGQQVVLVDTSAKKMAVYQINGKGEIALKSVRNIAWDLRLDQFNALRPTPDEIRSMLPSQGVALP
jgi:hypothetical protein